MSTPECLVDTGSEPLPAAKAARWIDRVETLLLQRNLAEASQALTRAHSSGADPSRCAGLAWQIAMLHGDFESAWRVNDALRQRGTPDPHRFWLGKPIDDAEVIVRCLHGLGDAVQMLRFAPLLEARARRVTYEVPPRLLPLARCFHGVDHAITWGDAAPPAPPPWEVQAEIMELPYLLRSTLGDLPGTTPYLALPPTLLNHTAQTMGAKRRPRVGIVWAGGEWNPARSMPPLLLQQALGSFDAEFWSLQGATGARPESGWPPRDGLAEVGDGLLPLAATIAHLDLVLTVDTLAAHLAGALGVPVWLMLRHAADWRWLTDRSDSPWYPSMRLFRQPAAGDWAAVAASVRAALDSHPW